MRGHRENLPHAAGMRVLLIFLVACGSGSSKPSGSTNDPVEICERVADVCRFDKAKLGVCVQARSGSGLSCQSQH
jgi:hypothetical protein